MEKISVVIPLYNKKNHIKRAIYSVINQTYEQFELIVVNDGSTDGGREKVKEIEDERIRLINQDNLGVSEARNKGVSEAKYNLIAFLDADDEWESEFLENLVCLAEKNPDAGILFSAFKVINSEETVKYPDFKLIPVEEGIIENYFKAALEGPFCASAMVIRKEVFDKLGGFTAGMKYGEDAYMWSKIALNYPVAYINKALSIIYLNADNRVSTYYELSDDFPLLDYISSLKKESINDYYIKEYVFKRFLLLAGRSLRVGDTKRAKLFISKAKTTKLFRKKYIKRRLDLYLSNPLGRFFLKIWRRLKT